MMNSEAKAKCLTRHVPLQQGPSLQCAPLDKEHFLQQSL